ncbi:MAG: hypothetical protein C5B50_24160 [Verrucomicrobia bacterium]|nr:MAG: hypothetical protein C5B50_24160 [Verrucomicrobiota bacterium]
MNAWLPGLLLFGCCILAYAPVWHAGFIWDDDRHVTQNPLLWEPGAWTKIWFSEDLPQYYPMLFTVWRLQYIFWKLDPAGYHWVNLLLHATSSVLVWRILRRLQIPGAWLAAALFALHPVNVESVAWVSQLKNTLAMAFFLLSLLFYLRSEEDLQSKVQSPKSKVQTTFSSHPDNLPAARPGSRFTFHVSSIVFYCLSVLSFVLGLLSKPAIAPLPFVLLLIAWWQRGRIQLRDVTRILPFFCATLVIGLVTYRMEQWRIGGEIVRSDGFLQRLAGAGWAVWFYLSKALFPVHLVSIYPRWEIPATRLLSYAPGIVLVAAFFLCWLIRRPWAKALLFGMFYFVIMLGPVLGFMNIGFMNYSLAADHWQYFAILGPLALVSSWFYTVLATPFSRHTQDETKKAQTGLRFPLSPAEGERAGVRGNGDIVQTLPLNCSLFFGALLLTMTILTFRQSSIYENSEKLWAATVAADPLCWQAHSILADTYVKESGLYEQAVSEYEQALALHPGFVNNENNLANVYRRLKQPQKAIEHLRKAVALDPRASAPHFNLGALLLDQGQVDEAITQFEVGITNAVLMDPHSESALADASGVVQAHLVVGNILLYRKGELDKAIGHYRTALQLKPDFADAHINLAEALTRKGLSDEVVKEYQAALAVKPDAFEAHQVLASLLFKRQQPREAVAHFQRALELSPDFARACDGLAWILATCPEAPLRDGQRALALAQKAESLTEGRNALVIRTLAAAYAEKEHYKEALAAAHRAEQLASEKNDKELLARLKQDTELYQKGSALRDLGYAGNSE